MRKLTQHSRPSFAELEEQPRLAQGQFEDLRYDDGEIRFWTCRCDTSDGARFDHQVSIEALRDGRWVTVGTYNGGEP